MNNEVKTTYITIIILIVILGGIAYFLQGSIDMPNITGGESTTTLTSTTNKTPKLITGTSSKETTTLMPAPEKVTTAIITTNKGVIEITFATNTPLTVKNFATLSVNNFYNGTRFHRVIRDFMIQGGDPLSKDVSLKNRWGTGGPGYTFADEVSPEDQLPQGTVAMANAGPNTNGSQFFIVTSIAGTPWLSGKHTVFGHVTKGMDVVLRIGDLQTNGQDQPLQDVIVEKVEIK
jgi:cyclophilin family peptidyl-prolyl cis-trans isomerase